MIAAGLMLVLEGLMPLLKPSAWRMVFTQMLSMSDGQLRFFGLLSVGMGALLLAWAL
jgi:uncharacterized protein